MAEIFPNVEDRRIVEYFLNGAQYTPSVLGIAMLDHARGGLYLNEWDDPIVFYDSAGAIMGQICKPAPVAVRVLNHMLYVLGDAREITRELRNDLSIRTYDQFGATGSRPIAVAHYFLGDEPVMSKSPFVLVGPLSVQAYRTTLGRRMLGAIMGVQREGCE